MHKNDIILNSIRKNIDSSKKRSLTIASIAIENIFTENPNIKKEIDVIINKKQEGEKHES